MSKRKVFGFAGVFLLVAGILLMPASIVRASEKEAEKSDEGILQQTVKAAEIKEEPDKDSKTLASLEKGTAVIVYGEPEDSFCRVESRGIEGYMESSVLELYQAEGEGLEAEQVQNLEQEFQSVEEDTLRTVDEYELLQKEKKASRIWGAVIAVMVVVIFVVGVVSALKQSREKSDDE